MYMPLQVMSKCFAVFHTWDEDYDRFTSQLREMSKKKEALKFSWRANSAHKKLEDRITRMRECVYCMKVKLLL